MLLESAKDQTKLRIPTPTATMYVAGGGPLSAGEMFYEDTGAGRAVKIAHLSEGFRVLFFSRRLYSAQEGFVSFFPISAGCEATLRPSFVPNEFTCSLVDVWELLCAQPSGEPDGPLLTSGRGTVLYESLNPEETDPKKVQLAAICLSWRHEFQGWHIYADTVGKPLYGLSEGMQVAFRTPLL